MTSQEDELPAGDLSDEGMVRRAKALACAAPLHALETYKGSLEGIDARGYRMTQLALHAIDQITIAMDFDHGADPDRVIDQLAKYAALQQPHHREEDHRRIAEWVVDKLINVGTVNRAFEQEYGQVDQDGTYRTHCYRFKLVVEASAEGKLHLRTTDQAINVLVGALDTDVESSQVAAEHKLRNLIERGRLDDAKVAAEQARHRTVQYAEQLRRQLDATRRNVRTVDWEEEVPELLEAALAHIESRYAMENQILAHITQRRDEADNPSYKQRATELVVIVRECISRHMRLQQHVQSAGAVFRREQDRQEFSGPPQRAALDLYGQLLLPALELQVRSALPVLAGYFRTSVAPVPPDAVALSSIVTRLCRSGPPEPPVGAVVPEPRLCTTADAPDFTTEQHELADRLLVLGDGPELLSRLLTRARRSGDPQVPKLVLHKAGHAFGAPIGSAVSKGATSLLLAFRTGDELTDAEYGGDDLLLTRLPVDRAAATAPPRPTTPEEQP
ncbi:hypothetical protein CFP65_1388 [Kitasatospora sp. MMS16-BH015]|uniref:hypothetical protein n=1 Tax=Kitasatospora sp. MMS16-BH015 TaxID=2018025 RepID=UPI000CA1742A|nr:hypothetical protein [Kitasatospora sp. MMS16-BH015]AUG76287.1 hypothetical protein CFP65_1388 [Kitasatospora sp. MMS16-BH015]